MEEIGNVKSNHKYLLNYPQQNNNDIPIITTNSAPNERRVFIIAKYQEKKWFGEINDENKQKDEIENQKIVEKNLEENK